MPEKVWLFDFFSRCRTSSTHVCSDVCLLVFVCVYVCVFCNRNQIMRAIYSRETENGRHETGWNERKDNKSTCKHTSFSIDSRACVCDSFYSFPMANRACFDKKIQHFFGLIWTCWKLGADISWVDQTLFSILSSFSWSFITLPPTPSLFPLPLAFC